MDTEENEDKYFNSYGDLKVHELMLDDEQRTKAYQHAIFFNREYFKDKVVMDVGCGTAILSIFCAQAGAKKVYAIEASDVANVAKEVVKENNFEDVVEVIHSKVEDVSLPGDEKVDIIVSEWMGFYLLHEGMLDSVLFARDKFLREGGEMFPCSASIRAATCSVPSLYKKWDKVYDVSMSSFGKYLRQSKSSKPQIELIDDDDLLSMSTSFCWLNLNEISVSDLNSISAEVVVAATKDGTYQAIALWFDCYFPNLDDSTNDELELCTGPTPFNLPTHWKQTVVVLPEEYEVEKSEPIAFRIILNRDKSCRRRYNIEVTMLDPEEVDHPLPCSCHLTKCIVTQEFLRQHPEGDNVENRQKELTSMGGLKSGILEDDPIDD